MEKKVTFEKKIDFPSMIGEITAICLDHDLKFIDTSNVEGDLLLSGKYKRTEASRLEEDFSYKIPVEIVLTDNIDLNTANIEIVDFSYELENENTMVCHIDLLIKGKEIVSEELEMERECDGEVIENEVEIPIVSEEDNSIDENVVDKTENIEVDSNSTEKENTSNNTSDFFFNLDDDKDCFGTFIVYIVRQNETINSILEKYDTTLDELEKYNDLNNLDIGSKVIIPLLKHE